jgi:hypothetical protein
LIRDSDLAEYLDSNPFLEHSEPQSMIPTKPDISSVSRLLTPATPEKPKRSAETEQAKHKSDVLKMVMDVFPGAKWTTKEEYRRLAQNRDRRGRKKRA